MNDIVQHNQTEIPKVEDLEQRFSFIRNSLLRTNISITFQYIIFQLENYEDDTSPGPIKYSIAKDIIENTASIVEAINHYWLEEICTCGDALPVDLFKEKYKFKKIKDICLDESGANIVACIEISELRLPSDQLKFVETNRALLKGKFITKNEFEKLEQLRTMRNKIHLKSLNQKINDMFDKKDINAQFDLAKEITNKVQTYIQNKNE